MSYGTSVPAVEQTTRILYYLASTPTGDATLTEICRAVDIHMSKGHALLATLRAAGLVSRRDPAKTYSLGPGVLTLARSLLDRTGLATSAEPYLADLAAASGCTALLGLVTAGRVFIVARREAPDVAVGVTIRVGHRYPVDWGAHGQAIAAFLPAEERAETPRGLAEVRLRGYAVDIGGMQAGVSVVSSPLLDGGGRPAAVLLMVGTFPAEEADDLGRRAAAAARRMSASLAPYLEGGS